MSKIIAIANQKGGVAKTATAVNLGVALSRLGKKVLLVDIDAQGDLTSCMCDGDPDELEFTIASLFNNCMSGEVPNTSECIRTNEEEGVDYLPGNDDLNTIALKLVSANDREYLLQDILAPVKENYDYILIDCPPYLGLLNVNALTAANSVLVPVMPSKGSLKGLNHLRTSIDEIRRRKNRGLRIEGILFTIVDRRNSFTKEFINLIRDSYSALGIYDVEIPYSSKGNEANANCMSVFRYAPRCKVTTSYEQLAKEVLSYD